MKNKRKKASKIIQMQIKERIKEIERREDKLNKKFLKETQIVLAYLEKEKKELRNLKMDLGFLLNEDFSTRMVREERIIRKINNIIEAIEELKKKIWELSE